MHRIINFNRFFGTVLVGSETIPKLNPTKRLYRKKFAQCIA